MSRLTRADKKLITHRRKAGATYREIADELGGKASFQAICSYTNRKRTKSFQDEVLDRLDIIEKKINQMTLLIKGGEK